MDHHVVALELEPLLVELSDLALSAKQAHWNVTGPLFRPLHAQLDELADDARTWCDDVAERLVAIGIPADGRVGTVQANTPFDTWPDGFLGDSKVVPLIVARLEELIDRTRQRAVRLAVNEIVSEAMLVEIAKGLERHRWMFRVQQG
jgi:starvation-inducible DNA-binding protein